MEPSSSISVLSVCNPVLDVFLYLLDEIDFTEIIVNIRHELVIICRGIRSETDFGQSGHTLVKKASSLAGVAGSGSETMTRRPLERKREVQLHPITPVPMTPTPLMLGVSMVSFVSFN
jgi:hypothetical protein